LKKFANGVISAMKFLTALFVYLLLAFFLGWGILLAVKGSLWLLVVSSLAYLVMFFRIGCMPKAH